PRTGVDRNASDGFAGALALACVHADPYVEPEVVYGGAEGRGAPDGARRPVERGEEAVAAVVQRLTAMPRDLPADDGVMPVEQLAPGAIAEGRSALRRADDVGEEHRGEHAVDVDR